MKGLLAPTPISFSQPRFARLSNPLDNLTDDKTVVMAEDAEAVNPYQSPQGAEAPKWARPPMTKNTAMALGTIRLLVGHFGMAGVYLYGTAAAMSRWTPELTKNGVIAGLIAFGITLAATSVTTVLNVLHIDRVFCRREKRRLEYEKDMGICDPDRNSW